MVSDLTAKADEAVTTMRSGSDHDVLRALLDLATEPPTAVVEFLVNRLVEREPPGVRVGTAAGARLPDDGTIAEVYELVQRADGRGLMDLGGGTYDGMVALLVAILAALDDQPSGAQGGAAS